MRRFAAVAITSGALVAGLTATASPAVASARQATADFGVAATTVREGTIAGKSLLAAAKSEGKPYSAKETAAMNNASACRWYERTQGRKSSAHGHWLLYVTTRLTWCYDGLYVNSARATFKAYTYNNRVYRWRGWLKKSLTHTRTWSSTTAEVQGRFSYAGRTYQSWAIVMGAFNGQYRYWYGG